jgi:hypothetical protein
MEQGTQMIRLPLATGLSVFEKECFRRVENRPASSYSDLLHAPPPREIKKRRRLTD